MTDPIKITYQESWRSELWDDTVPSRQAWFVTCDEHPWVGCDTIAQPWGYAAEHTAKTTATRHRRAYHRPS